ncbi:MAG: Fe-S cluster assembly protein SufD [Gammaproteobacteria bacterium]|nr:Fe-S cluster assembly protein SufD [Gammaproteobacteria bacterium]
MTAAATEHYLKTHAAAMPELPGHALPWLRNARNDALSRFAAHGFPTPRDEEWKYTNVRPIEKRLFARAEQDPALESDRLLKQLGYALPARRMVFINGYYSSSLSEELESDTLTLADINSRLNSHPDSLAQYFSLQTDNENTFAALNTAFLQDGAFIKINKDRHSEKPVHLIFFSVPAAEPVVCHPRIVISAAAGSSATVIESFIGVDGAQNFTNSLTDIYLEAGASLEHYKLQEESLKSFHIGSVRVRQEENSRFISHNTNLGGLLVRNDYQISLNAPHASADLNGLYLVQGRQHVDNHLRIDHASPHTNSGQLYRGVLNGHGRAVFNGKVVVHKDAQKTDAQQNNANLLLSDNAEIDTKPELEIYADDVKCSHGATVGQLDDKALFYLRSRAIDEDTARGLLTFAFADHAIARMKIRQIRDHLESIVIGKLPDSELIKEFV